MSATPGKDSKAQMSMLSSIAMVSTSSSVKFDPSSKNTALVPAVVRGLPAAVKRREREGCASNDFLRQRNWMEVSILTVDVTHLYSLLATFKILDSILNIYDRLRIEKF